MKQSAWQTVMGILLLGIVALVSWQAGTLVAVQNDKADADKARPVVVIDAGHGGNDPGLSGSIRCKGGADQGFRSGPLQFR